MGVSKRVERWLKEHDIVIRTVNGQKKKPKQEKVLAARCKGTIDKIEELIKFIKWEWRFPVYK